MRRDAGSILVLANKAAIVKLTFATDIKSAVMALMSMVANVSQKQTFVLQKFDPISKLNLLTGKFLKTFYTSVSICEKTDEKFCHSRVCRCRSFSGIFRSAKEV